MTTSVGRFQEFLRIRSISAEGPVTGEYAAAAEWLCTQGQELGLQVTVLEPIANKPIVIMKCEATDPALPALVLNSHYDVVPVFPEHWNCDAFSAVRTENGRIYGRGAQDMKSVCVQYLEALRALKEKRGGGPLTFRRRVVLTFVPDEECGGAEGMGTFVTSAEWKALQPVGLVLDEGLANPVNAYTVFYGERQPWWVLVKSRGPTGHGSRFIKDTAVSKLINVANRAMAYRAEQEALLGDGGCKHSVAKKLGDVTTVNLTMLRAGDSSDGGKTYPINLIPTEATAGFDIRVSPSLALEEVSRMLDEWTAAEGVSWEFAPWTAAMHTHHVTSLDPKENPWFHSFRSVIDARGVALVPEIFPAATDSRFIRQLGIPALGFSPMRNTPILLHEHDEYIDESVFLEGIDVYTQLIPTLAETSRFDVEQ
eukprot:NODE_1548_length_1497_cov_15.716160_g1397_i0.p1 GENE.NODE_1548_length_1497_cov_15.716160_g1397_i0~~NODE_1548_length_1497_cov_15.716160_g1397_i0.p1  ORF type:complete len:425 (+),score=72.70 NODE_1548_length_1497_cov_15.716160_g1397_i0:90-1364(+)